jgi:superfamily II DNA/RNA helicase
MTALKKGASVVIATPGRLISHMQMDNIDLSKLSFFILDEADRMLDMGFSDDILTITKQIPKSCQTIMFSATMPAKIEDLAKTLLKNPLNVKIAVSKPAEKIRQSAYVCYQKQKDGILGEIFKTQQKRVIIFSGKKQRVKEIYRNLVKKNVSCGAMHSDLSQAERDDMMFRFKSGSIDVLVATDIVARGIDIDDIQMVINYDVPRDVEDYVHRIGRTARAERDGIAITLVSDDEIYLFKRIEKFLGREIEKNVVPAELGDAPDYKSDKAHSTTANRNKKRHGGARRHGANNKNNTHNNTNPKQKKNERNEKQVRPGRKEFSGNRKRKGNPTVHPEQQQGS